MGQLETGNEPDAIGTAPTPERAVQEPGTIREVPRWAVLLLAALLIGSWSTWAVHAYRAELRMVTVDEFRSDLAQGSVRSYDTVTAVHEERVWPPGRTSSYDTAQTPDPGAPSTRRPGFATVAYHVDAWVAPIRIVTLPTDDGAQALDARQLVQELEAAGVPPRDRMPAEVPQANPAEVAQVSGFITGLLALGALFAIRPTRGTRWFWFWILGAPLGLGVPAYVVAECLLPRRMAPSSEDRGSRGRLPGLVGFLIQLGTKLLIPF